MSTTPNEVVPTDVKPSKLAALKKFIPSPKAVLIGAGVAFATVAGILWFAVKRQDEEDFETEFAAESEETPSAE